jgi:hypothetical protein
VRRRPAVAGKLTERPERVLLVDALMERQARLFEPNSKPVLERGTYADDGVEYQTNPVDVSRLAHERGWRRLRLRVRHAAGRPYTCLCLSRAAYRARAMWLSQSAPADRHRRRGEGSQVQILPGALAKADETIGFVR